MARPVPPPPLPRAARVLAAAVLLAAGAAQAALAPKPPPPRPGKEQPQLPIYSCVDAQGNRLSSDRPIPECSNQDQRLLNRDGTFKATVPPAQTPEQQARTDAAKRVAEQARLAREAEARRDRALLHRYPDQATHDAARAKAQEAVTRQIESAQRRLQELDVDTQALAHEREAVTTKTLPQSLRARIASNEGAIEAQQTILHDQQAERDRLNQQFDAELNRLRALWAGAVPGRLGPIQPAPVAASRPASAP
ncbi:MAG: hypothetical protein U1F53_15235 [Burkholderiaceae bacterium]